MAVKTGGFEFWNKVLKSSKYVVAPMVDQSELPWRMLGRKYGAQLCYTPMLHAALFGRDKKYRKENFVTCEKDRPLIVQFCANNPEVLLEAARYVAPHCDAVDINLGCPQSIAKKGHYGAFLQDEWDLLTSMISLLHRELSVPVTCKIRVFSDIKKTVQYAKMLEKAGCQLLTVHGRTREQKGGQTGLASWEHIKAVKQSIDIPVFANGNIQFLEDVERCVLETGVDGVMSAETHLFNPALFVGEHPPCWRISEEYLSLVRQYPCSTSSIRGHLFKIWLQVLKEAEFCHLREKVGSAKTLEEFEEISALLKSSLLERLSEEDLKAEFTRDSIPFWRCQPYIRPNRGILPPSEEKATADGSESVKVKLKKAASEERERRKKRVAEIKATQGPIKKKRWFGCDGCNGNPKGLKCVHSMCKTCCRLKCLNEHVSCEGHRFTPRPLESARNENTYPEECTRTEKELHIVQNQT